MRRYLFAPLILGLTLSVASAADLTYSEPSPSYSESYDGSSSTDWTGAYVGGFGGIASGDTTYDRSNGTGYDQSAGGAFGGVQAGYDVQMGNALVGGVADFALTDIDAEASSRERIGTSERSQTVSTTVEHLGTVRARAGYASDRVLAYGHAGLAYGKTETTIDDGLRTGSLLVSNSESRKSDTKYGYAVGAGLELKATDSVSVQTEYGYHDLGEDRLYKDAQGVSVNQDIEFHTLKTGLNFRF
ncbi:outer membrane protein [Fulvimarina sp. 2208YS6-2-32]|uniref:Outer membrane protein n=1 Tax=Fulvimarina uroteuthidis TaxID=3098149 RepID=A0ABU5I5F2_9HYPH|nr:outer membrane protein [Fulvimarina sp. 2208YS6-2-32]MDY8110148.1 outer membrane protein [Fulvimarina sp. 2208YS6-2-32]